MIAIYLPTAWLALIVIILAEAGYGIRRLPLPAGRSLLSQTIVNGASTLVGLPVTWVVLAIVEGLLGEPVHDVHAPGQ
ncbi:MAG: hypothetical protein HY294_00875 [Candidatus Rokubacteria bacterium]|nr:hypothetical protein [Candidatus Rokubacteria bacterium]MBI3824533.1 hypothetical protein [Candidatus Rokubacteria bacterium]